MTTPFIFIAAAGCGAAMGARDHDASVSDGEGEGPPPDGSTDGLPNRPGINERWATLDNCSLQDLVSADEKLYALCKGNPNRLVRCPLTGDIQTTSCEDFVTFDETPYLNGEALEIAPLVHNVLDDHLSLVTFTSVPDNYPGFFVVDRSTSSVVDMHAYETAGIRVGSDLIAFQPNHPWGALVLGGHLLLATRNQDLQSMEENYLGGTVLFSQWNGDGTVTDKVDKLGVPFLFSTDFSPTLFLPGGDGNSAWLLGNGFVSGGEPTPASFDLVTLDMDGNPFVDPDQNVPLGAKAIEPFTHFALSPDQGALLLAGEPDSQEGAKLYTAAIGSFVLGEGLALPENERIQAAQWISDGNQEQAFASVAKGEEPSILPQVYRVALDGGDPSSLSTPFRTYGEEPKGLAVVASDSSCIIYQGLILSETQSAVTAIACGAWDLQ